MLKNKLFDTKDSPLDDKGVRVSIVLDQLFS